MIETEKWDYWPTRSIFREKLAYFIGSGKNRRLDFPIASTTKQSKSFVDQMKTLTVSCPPLSSLLPFASADLTPFSLAIGNYQTSWNSRTTFSGFIRSIIKMGTKSTDNTWESFRTCLFQCRNRRWRYC